MKKKADNKMMALLSSLPHPQQAENLIWPSLSDEKGWDIGIIADIVQFIAETRV